MDALLVSLSVTHNAPVTLSPSIIGMLRCVIAVVQGTFPTSLAQDITSHETASNDKLKLAIRYRMEKKKLLAKQLEVLKKMMADMPAETTTPALKNKADK